MPSRRGGRKSHHGCQNCKTRHLKCDEVWPTCGRCLKRKQTCLRTNSLQAGHSTPPQISSTEQIVTASEAQQPQPDFNIPSPRLIHTPPVLQDLPVGAEDDKAIWKICSRLEAGLDSGDDREWLDELLLQHYLAVVSWTLDQDPRVLLLYNQAVPELALQHEPLRHAMLTISASHCVAALSSASASASVSGSSTSTHTASQRVIDSLIEHALLHHNQALSLFVKQIALAPRPEDMTQDDVVSVTWASIFILISFTSQLQPAFRQAPPGSIPGAIDTAVAMLNLSGPIANFFMQYQEHISSSHLRIFQGDYLPNLDEGIAAAPREAEKSLDAVSGLCTAASMSETDRQFYNEAVHGLRQTLGIITLNPGTMGGRFSWAHGETAIFMANNVYKRQPEALILLAHWAACLVPWLNWWGSDFGGQVIIEVVNEIPPAFSRFLDWPRSRLASLHSTAIH